MHKVAMEMGKWAMEKAKTHGFDNLSAQDCINRNIVECKEGFPLRFADSSLSINRNIVECKDREPVRL